MAKLTPSTNATATTSASSAGPRANPFGSAAAAPVPTRTGATALGNVRGRAPSTHSDTLATSDELNRTTDDRAAPYRAAGSPGPVGSVAGLAARGR